MREKRIIAIKVGRRMKLAVPVSKSNPAQLSIPAELRPKDAFDFRPEVISELPEDRFDLHDGLLIDENDKRQAYFIDIAMKQKYLVGSKEEANRNPNALFYIEDREKEAEVGLTELENQLEAQNLIRELSHEKLMELAALLGFSGKDLSLTQLKSTLYSVAKNKPYDNPEKNYNTILKLMKDPDYNYKLLFAYLIFDNVIRKDNGNYLYNEVFIGTGKEQVVAFMKDEANEAVVGQWKMIYAAKEVKKKK